MAIVVGAFELVKYTISRFTGNGSKGINDRIKELQDNHIHEVQDTLNRVDKRTEEMNLHLIKIIEILRK